MKTASSRSFSSESSNGFALMTGIEHLLQHQRLVVLLVLRAVYQSDRSLFALLFQQVDSLLVRAQFLPIPHLEFLPPGRVVSEPLAQFRGRRDVFEPKVDRSLL